MAHMGGTKSKLLGIVIATTLSATLVILVLFGFCRCYYNRRKKREEEDDSPGDQLLDLTEDHYMADGFDAENKVESNKFPLIRLSLIQTATQQFSMENKLGEGGFGPVYKGTLVDGKEIAVKRLSRNSGQGLQEFKAEVTLIAKLQHKNLVKLLGCCLEGRELLLVYDYMPNKSLDVHLFDSTMGAQLDWTTRLSIINGIARGILYLHEDSRLRIIHRDLKASNILLDHEMNPKISDFGMARIFGSNQIQANTNRVVGTYGYMAPEYAMEGIFSVKSDVYSFGVLLLEVVSGRKNSGFHLAGNGHSLLTYTWNLWSSGKGLELMDPSLSDTYVESEVLKCIQIGLLCVQEDPADRPIMSTVVHMLGSSTIPVRQPTQPAFSVGRAVAFSQQRSIDLDSSVSARQIMPSRAESHETESSASISHLTITDSLPR
nr:PREDICTED: cysteine-rich receptor-like protein kinase 6 [Daucus carota subsp. sativus]